MSRIRTIAVSVALVVTVSAFLSVSNAQGPGGRGGPSGGRGGRGQGGGGPGGGRGGRSSFAPLTLVTEPPVQKEIELTDEQKSDVDSLVSKVRAQQDRISQANRRGGRGGPGGGPNGGFGGPGGAGFAPGMSRQEQQAATDEIEQQGEAALAKILKKPQRERIYQISLQREGPMAVATRPEVQQKLNMGEDQIVQIEMLIADSRQNRAEFMRASRFNGGGPGRRGPGQDPAQANTGGGRRGGQNNQNQDQNQNQNQANGEEEGEGAPANAPDAKPKVDPARAKMQAGMDAIDQKLVSEIAKVLTKNQKSAFNRMLGEPFDPTGKAPATKTAAASTKKTKGKAAAEEPAPSSWGPLRKTPRKRAATEANP